MSKTWSDGFRYLVITALSILAIAFLFYVKVAIQPLIVSALIAYLFNPMVEWLARHPRVSRKLVVNVVFLLVLATFIAIPTTFIPILIGEIETFANDLREVYAFVVDYLSTPITILDWKFEPQTLLPAIEDIPLLNVGFLTGEALHLVEAITLNVLWLLVILATIYFLLLDWGKIKRGLLSFAPEDYHNDLRRLYRQITDVWDGYLRGNLILMFITAISFSIAWTIIGLPASLLLGIMMGLFAIVPDIGPMVAAGITVLVALLQGSTTISLSNGWFAVLVFVIYFILINIKSLWLRTILFGRSVKMHEGLVFILIMLSVIVQGIMGAIIVIPLVASATILLRYILRKVYKLPPF
ncbi:MAG: AI-2E family transporter, partial [Chloroflexota bacterium]